MPEGGLREDFFPQTFRERLESLGDVTWNPHAEEFSETDLCERIPGVDVLVTGWGSPCVTPAVVEAADDLALVAHTGGSVADLVDAAVYDAGIDVVSANDVMADHVAEHVLGATIASLRNLSELDASMKRGDYGTDGYEFSTLYGSSVGLVGLGTIGRKFLAHLASFGVTAHVYDPYVDASALEAFDFADTCNLDDALRADVVSVHAARTPETIGMLGSDELAIIPDGALFVNTARAELVDETALLTELCEGRFSAVLDVYHEEPLPADHELRSLDNVLLTPHVGGSQIRPALAASVLDDVERSLSGEPLMHAIPRSQWAHMTS